MTLDKKIPKRRDIIAVADWKTIIDLTQVTEEIIKELPYKGNTQNLCSPELSDTVQDYFAPFDTESFNDYRTRVFDEFFGTGMRKGIATILFSNKAPLGFYGQHPSENSYLKVHSLIEETKYQTYIVGTGSYAVLAERVIYGVKRYMDDISLPYDYKAT